MTDARADAAPARGRRFILQRRIGAGAFGEVFLAEQDSGAGFRRRVALKVLHADVARSKSASKRMRDEARILGRLSHRNVVGVLDLVRLGDRWAVVMEYVPGADLEQVLVAQQHTGELFSPPAALGILAALGRALDAAWTTDDGQGGQLRVVHRDIKPSNVRLTPDGEVKVLDFGVARVELDEREAATKAGALIGTERYMSPEMLLRQPSGPSSDVYAAGATIAELLLGEAIGITPVFPDKHATFVADRLAAIADRLHLPDDQKDAILALLADCLDANPDQRPSAIDLADRATSLARHVDGADLETFARLAVANVLRVLGPEGELVEGSLTEHATSGPATSQGSEPALGTFMSDDVEPFDRSMSRATLVDELDHPLDEQPARRSPVLLLLTAAAVLVLVAIGIGAFLRSGGPAVASPTEPAVPAEIAAPIVAEPVVAPIAPVDEPEPEPKPAAEAAPAPDPVDVPTPAASEPKRARVTPATTPPPAPAAAAAPAPAPVAAGPLVSRAQVSVANATSVTVRCGTAEASGTASVRLRDFPAGACTVKAMWEGRALTTTVTLDRPMGLQCDATAGGLSCHP